MGNDQHGVLAAVRALRAANYTPYLAIDKPGTYAGRSRATVGTVRMPNPDVDREGFVRTLAAAARRLRVAAVLPSADSHFLALAGREADFALGTPSRESVDQATDKALLTELAAAAGLQTPPTKCVRGEAVKGVGYPAIIKPLRSRVQNPDGTISTYSAHFVSDGQIEQALARLLLTDGERRRALRGLLPQRGTAHAIFSLRDPMPLLTSVAKLTRLENQKDKGPFGDRLEA